MNKIHRKRLEILADWLEKGGETQHMKFRMDVFMILKDASGANTWHPKLACSTACCMAGALVQTFAPREVFQQHPYSIDWLHEAGKLSGLSFEKAMCLFAPSRVDMQEITATKAAKVVRHLLATGNVDWRVARFANKN